MFIEKSGTEVITIDHEIKVVGLNLQSSGLPITFDSLGLMWERLTAEVIDEIKQKSDPVAQYGVCLNEMPDYVVGCPVDEFDAQDKSFYCCTIPAGTYIKDFFNAKDFVTLTYDTMMKRDVNQYAKEHGLTINGKFSVEVYPDKYREYPEMYTLTPIL